MKAGKAEDVYFGKGSFVAVGDPYVQKNPKASMRTIKPINNEMHDREFKPAKDPGVKVPTAPYPYKEEGPPAKKSYKNEDGEIETGPRNFTTIPLKKGNVGKNTSFGGPIPYLEDDYNLKKKLYKKELEEHKAMLEKIGDGKPFSSFAKKKKWGTFNDPIHVYGEDVPLPAKEKKEPV